MSPSKLGVFAQLALAASAVLVPSSMSMEDMEALAINPLNFAVTLDCPGCPLASPQGDSYKLTPDVGSALVGATYGAIAYIAVLTCHSV
jgi:hypothetical protein